MDIVPDILQHNFFDPNSYPLENGFTDIRMKFTLSNIHYMDANSHNKNK